jgi:hypothetical protein
MFPTPSISLHKRDVSQNDITPGFFDKELAVWREMV